MYFAQQIDDGDVFLNADAVGRSDRAAGHAVDTAFAHGGVEQRAFDVRGVDQVNVVE